MPSVPLPLGTVRLRWRTAEEGGRTSGPPPGPSYAATAIFAKTELQLADEEWVQKQTHASIVLEYMEPVTDHAVLAKFDFYAVRDEVRPNLREGVVLGIMEGLRVVAAGEVEAVY